MKSVGKLALLAITLLINTQQQVEAHQLQSRIRIRTFEPGQATDEAPAAVAPTSEPTPVEEEKKNSAPAEEQKTSAPVEEKNGDAEGEQKEEAKEQVVEGKQGNQEKLTAAIAKDETKGEVKKQGKVVDAAAEAEEEAPPTLLDPGASAGQSHTVDALQTGPCVSTLNITEYEMIKQMEYFSRRLEIEYFNNAMTIWLNLTKDGRWDAPLMVHTWELYDKAFQFPRVRRYAFVQNNLDMLEHFEDNLNTNVSNRQALANFLRVANTVRHNLNEKYGKLGGFDDPSLVDPYEIKIESWATVKLPDPVF